ncbi:MAG: TatD family hydrolase [Planctomycetaceae bacterium]|nr:TatD family hydrolase [Planctomycetaceae bacterium]
MELIDTHAHLDEDAFGPDLPAVIARAEAAGLVGIITIGTTVASCRRAIELAETHPTVFAAIGIHPNYAAQAAPGDWEIIERLAEHPRVVGIGETGLDRYWDHTPIDVQQDYFRRHIALARHRDVPFIVHCRDAEADVAALLEETAAGGAHKGVMHSFCGTPETAARTLALGMHLSFSGMLTYKKNQAIRDAARAAPADRILVETDCPYLAPATVRGKRNEPAWVRETAEVLGQARGLSHDEAGTLTTDNARRLFALPV